MLMAAPTPKGAGIVMYGNAQDLTSVEGTIRKACQGMRLPEQTLLVPIGIANELGEAAAGRREHQRFGFDEYDGVEYCAVKIPWPPVLFSVPFVRWSSLFGTVTAQDQANLFRLQWVVEEALREYDPKTGAECARLLRLDGGVPTTYLGGFIQHATATYLQAQKEGRAPLDQLPTIMRSFQGIVGPYKEYAKQVDEVAGRLGRNPSDVIIPVEMPPFEW